MDQNSLESVRHAAGEFIAKNKQLNVLVCNAGVMAVPAPGTKTKDGFETQFGVNHLSHFLLFNLLKPLLLSSSTPDFNSRVVMVSSSGHHAGGVKVGDYGFEKSEYTPWSAYGQSKTANIYMANEIERRYGTKGLHSNSLMPGGIDTGLQVHIPLEMRRQWFDSNPTAKSPAQGAATTVLAAVGKDWEGVGGKYLDNCAEAPALDDGGVRGAYGYMPHAFDEGLEKQLWTDSLAMVGLKDERELLNLLMDSLNRSEAVGSECDCMYDYTNGGSGSQVCQIQ